MGELDRFAFGSAKIAAISKIKELAGRMAVDCGHSATSAVPV
jgi:hypothetical protein